MIVIYLLLLFPLQKLIPLINSSMTDFDNYLYNQVIKLRKQGLTQKEIVKKLCVPIKTVESIIIKEYYS